MEYRHGFCKGLAVFLLKLYESNGPTETASLKLTYGQRTNSQKLRYWDLAEAVTDGQKKHKRGWWQITDKGRDFVEGRVTIQKRVVMKNNKRMRFEGEAIHFHEVCDGFQLRGDYAHQARQQVFSDF